MKTKAKLLPLEGKYYGTKIKLNDSSIIEIWIMGNSKPSERELAGLSEEEQEGYFSDSHYESEYGYNIAKELVTLLNEKEIKGNE